VTIQPNDRGSSEIAEPGRARSLPFAGPAEMNNPADRKSPMHIGLLTGGDDKTYALGLTSALISQGIYVDFVGSDAVDGPELHGTPLVNFLNLRGDQSARANIVRKMARILVYYGRLIGYAAVARPPLFHILWNNKFELIDRILLMLYYRLLGKKIAFTAHNVNAAQRDSKDNLLNRLSLRFQYRMADHIFVHTERMKDALRADFGVPITKVSVIPFGINNVFPRTQVSSTTAKEHFSLRPGEKTVLFFGQIAPYKGLEYLVAAMVELKRERADLRLIIAGKPKPGNGPYWDQIQQEISRSDLREQVIEKIQFIPDNEVELYFKAADVVIVPYTHIFQSGVPFLAYSFGLPVVATDVGSLREDIIEGKTGFICKPRDPVDLAKSIQTYFASDLYRQLETQRQEIQDFANQKHSWTKVGEITRGVYAGLLGKDQF
jgi:D-inositol-3-phosphate glycosyltransferase